jgi:hypothetical protein
MSQGTIEADVESLRARISILEQDQEVKKAETAKLGRGAFYLSLFVLATEVALFISGIWLHDLKSELQYVLIIVLLQLFWFAQAMGGVPKFRG